MKAYLYFVKIVVLVLVCDGNVSNRRRNGKKFSREELGRKLKTNASTARRTKLWRNPFHFQRLVEQKELYPKKKG